METRAPVLGEPLPVELMNTIWADSDGVHDALATADEAAVWLAAFAARAGIASADLFSGMDAADIEQLARRLRRLRDALRRLAAEVTADPRPAASSPVADLEAAVAEVNRAAAATPRWWTLNWTAGAQPSRTAHAAKPGSHALVSQIAEGAVTLFATPQQPRLRACLAPGCVLYFTKTHPRREWCSPACGNRARVARHYRRHHPHPS
jgi:predicted RNA-binding Zn ribbon-like protein